MWAHTRAARYTGAFTRASTRTGKHAPLHVIPQSVAEQIDAKAAQALLTAQAVKAAADAGKFNGKDGKSFEIKGYYASTAALEEGVPAPAPGDAYCVGSAAPYDVYIYDGVNGEWVNNGTIQGAKGDTGAPGTTFTPHVDGNGNLSWTNDGGLDNPATQNIRGAAGPKGETGPAGKSAYAAAVEAGYTGTEATFYAALTAMPYHNARHLPDGADPITVKAGNLAASAVETAKIKDKAVTGAKIADGTVTQSNLATSARCGLVISANAGKNLENSDAGNTYYAGWTSAGSTKTWTLNAELSAAISNGFAVAFTEIWPTDKTRLSISGVRLLHRGEGTLLGKSQSAVLGLVERCNMIALQKMSTDATNGDVWLITGDVEVVS